MTSCPYDYELEALVSPDSAQVEFAALRLHVAGCAACAAELDMLRQERRLFEVRAEASMPAPRLAIDVVFDEAPCVVATPSSGRRGSSLPWAHVLVAACAACALIVARLPRPLEAASPTNIAVAVVGASDEGALASTVNASFIAEEPRVCVGFDMGLASSVSSSERDDGRRFCSEIVTSSTLRP